MSQTATPIWRSCSVNTDFAGSKRVQHELLYLNACRAHTLTQVVHRRGGGGDDVRFHFEAVAVHPFRVADAVLPVHARSRAG